MDKYTFGNSQSEINLVSSILTNPQYAIYSRKVARLLSKQFQALNMVSTIPDERIKRHTMRMWHERFVSLLNDLPEIVKTHTLCVETGKYRQLLKTKSPAQKHPHKLIV